jgi:hypothetical protein
MALGAALWGLQVGVTQMWRLVVGAGLAAIVIMLLMLEPMPRISSL